MEKLTLIATVLFAGGASVLWGTGKDWAKWCAIVGGAILAILAAIALFE